MIITVSLSALIPLSTDSLAQYDCHLARPIVTISRTSITDNRNARFIDGPSSVRRASTLFVNYRCIMYQVLVGLKPSPSAIDDDVTGRIAV